MIKLKKISVAIIICVILKGLLSPHIIYANLLLHKTDDYHLVTKIITESLEYPWGLAFLPNGLALVTERPGRLNLISLDGSLKRVQGLPKIWVGGQGGLLDIAVDPNFSKNKTIYFTFSKPFQNGTLAGTALARATIKNLTKPELSNLSIIFAQNKPTKSRYHFGSRIVISPKNKIFLTIGERGDRKRAQDPFDYAGSIIRIHKDGSIPKDNPFASGIKGLPKIWSIGHRNPQGAAWNLKTNSIWTISHGPKGGDEVNQPLAGKNYGWPIISYGLHYSGAKIGKGSSAPGMEQPVYYWDPSIAPSGATFYNGQAFPKWKDNLFIAALKSKAVVRLELKNQKIIREERLFRNNFGRIRDIQQGPRDYLYIITDESKGKLIAIQPGS